MMRSWFVTDGGVRVPAISSGQMAEVDRVAVGTGLSVLQMMEHAGRALAWHAMDLLGGTSGTVLVLAGGGGNGGGGWCAARHLANRGVAVSVVMAGDRHVPAAAEQRRLYGATPGRVLDRGDGLVPADLVIDAMVGYGLREAPRGVVRDLIQQVGAVPAPILALDVPSGVDATTGATPGVHVTAHRTLTLALPKTGLDVPAVGDLWLADLGIPEAVYRQAAGIAVPAGVFGTGFSVPWSADRRESDPEESPGGRERLGLGMSRLVVMPIVALALVAAACGAPNPGGEGAAGGGHGSDTTVSTNPVTVPTRPDGLPAGPSALRDRLAPEFPDPLIDVSQIFSGGPPPDGIPSIDDPRFIDPAAASAWLGDLESVVVVTVDGDARAYPTQVLIWHEIVNDVVGGVPVAVTYCPLCNSAVAWERTIDGVVTTFGTSGSLFNSALVMYDRATESLWTHYDGRAVVGLLAGRALQVVPAPLMAFGDFKAAHPDGVVLDRDATGFARDYGRNPYVGYDSPDGTPFLFRGSVDERAVAMQRVAGVNIGEASVAWSLEAISGGEARATAGRVGDTPVVILWKSGQRSALDTADTEVGRDVGSVGVFVSRIDDRSLTFDAVGPDFVDRETGSTWNIAGVAVAGELAGSALERVAHLDTFWFAWSTYRPGTTLHTE